MAVIQSSLGWRMNLRRHHRLDELIDLHFDLIGANKWFFAVIGFWNSSENLEKFRGQGQGLTNIWNSQTCLEQK